MGRKKSRKAHTVVNADSAPCQLSNCYEGERLSALLKRLEKCNCYEGECLSALLTRLEKEIESARLLKGMLPEKIWIKQQFSIGVNDVTRVLERMSSAEVRVSEQEAPVIYKHQKISSVQLQAVLLASDCDSRWLTKHLPGLASSRSVPLILVRDRKAGSLRLGELVKLKTALAIGIKAKGSGINKAIEEILSDSGPTRAS